MKIYMDTNEYIGHPQIKEGIIKYLNSRLEKNENYEMFTNNEVISKHLEVGDYQHNKIIIEHKVLSDFGGSVIDGRIFQQAQDLLYCMSLDPEVKGYILISGNIADILKLSYISPDKKIQYPFKLSPMIAAAASLNRIGVPTIFLGDQYCFINFMIDLFTKYYDGKNREYNPVRRPIQLRDEILTNYCGIPGISEQRAILLQKRFPTPKDLYNATKEQLMEVEGIKDKISNTIIEFTNGLRPKEIGKIGENTIYEIICRKCGTTMNTIDKEKRYCGNCTPFEQKEQKKLKNKPKDISIPMPI